jgi:glycosyltransferase involved in cell wall biosynthesis
MKMPITNTHVRLLVTEALPPGDWGSVVLMANLLRGLRSQDWVVVTSENCGGQDLVQDFRVLTHKESYLTPMPDFFGAGYIVQARSILRAHQDSSRIAKQLEGSAVHGVVTMFPPDFSVLLGWMLARRLNVPLTFILFDLYQGSRHGLYKMVARALEPALFRQAKRIIFLHEGLRRYYAERYRAYDKAEWKTIRHPLDLEWYRRASADSLHKGSADDPCRVVFTGSVYYAQRDAVQRMCDAVNGMPPGTVFFEIYTHTPRNSLNLTGIEGLNVRVDRRPRDEMPGIQASADILFLPLAFHSTRPEVVQTALPAKYPEYLASGVPILVHAPPWSWLAQLARKEGFAYVVDVDDVQRLRNAVRTLATDVSLRAALSSRAREVAKQHDHIKISNQFKHHLELQ